LRPFRCPACHQRVTNRVLGQLTGHTPPPPTDYSRWGLDEDGPMFSRLVPRGSGAESVVHDLLEGHLSTERDGGGEGFRAESGRKGRSRLLVQALFTRLRGMPGFLTERID